MRPSPPSTALALCLALASAQPANISVLVGRGDTLLGFTTTFNTPSPGNALALAVGAAVPWSALPFFNLSYNFVSGATTSEMLTPRAALAPALVGGVPGALGLAFAAFNPSAAARASVLVTATDAAGRTHGTSVELAPGWGNYSLPFAAAARWWPANASWALPLSTLAIGPARSPPFASDAGWVGVADVAIVAAPPAPGAVPAPVAWLLAQPAPATGGVLVAGPGSADAPAALGAYYANRLPTPCAVDLRVERRNATGPMGEGAGGGFDDSWESCGAVNATLRPWQSALLACAVDAAASPPGYIVMRAVLRAASCWGANDTVQGQVVLEGALALVAPQPGAAARAAAAAARAPGAPPARVPAVFGGQMLLPDAAAAARLGMLNVRTTGAVWAFTQRVECWDDGNATCFAWAKADAAVAALVAQGMELTLCAMEDAPAWAADRNGTAFWPARAHYADFARWAGRLFDRYGAFATALECMNEVDGLSYFSGAALPLADAVALTVNLTFLLRDAARASVNGSHLDVFGLPTSLFDIKQQWPGGPVFRAYEDAVLAAPGMAAAIVGVTPHPYAAETFVPWAFAGRNTSFTFFNESANAGSFTSNSSAAQLLSLADALRAAGAPLRMRVTEFGYALAIPTSATEGWAVVHAAATAQALIHLRSAPLAALVEKAYLFAAFDGCCEEQNSFFGAWRPAQKRMGAAALRPYTQPTHLEDVMPLPAAAAFAATAALIDVPAGRAAGVFVVDNTAGNAPAAALRAPSCVAFESAAPGVGAVAAIFTTNHDPNARVAARVAFGAGAPPALLNGLGAPMALNASGAVATLAVGSLPQFLVFAAQGTTATAACASLVAS